MKMPSSPIASCPFERLVDIESGVLLDFVAACHQERLRAKAALIAKHAQEVPLGIEFRGRSKSYDEFIPHHVDAHVRPMRPFARAGVSNAIIFSSFSRPALNATSFRRFRMPRAERGVPER